MRKPHAATDALLEVLEQLARVIGALTPEQYVSRPAGFAGSCIGTHVRHCLDHVAALLSAAATGNLDYDDRRRGTPVETDPVAALRGLQSMIATLRDLPEAATDRSLTLRIVLSPRGPSALVSSHMEREMAYVLSHTTHHNAIIGFLAHATGGETPDYFGYAASTVAYLTEDRCAR